MSFLEIYNEELYDLLAERPGDGHDLVPVTENGTTVVMGGGGSIGQGLVEKDTADGWGVRTRLMVLYFIAKLLRSNSPELPAGVIIMCIVEITLY